MVCSMYCWCWLLLLYVISVCKCVTLPPGLHPIAVKYIIHSFKNSLAGSLVSRGISVYLSQYLTNLMHKICFTISFISCLWCHHTYRYDDTRGCVMQFWPPDDEHMCSKHVEAWNKTYCETIVCIKLIKYWDKYLAVSSMLPFLQAFRVKV